MVTTTRRMKFRFVLTGALLIFVFCVIVAGFYNWRDNQPPTLAEAFPSGTIIVGVDATYPPFAVDDGESLYGLDIDLGNEIAHRLDLEIRFVPMGFDGLYDALIDGQVDVLISALLVNQGRTRDVRYTRPYFDNGLLLVMDGSTQEFTVDDVASQSVALEYGSIAHSQANRWLERRESFTIQPYELPQYALDAIRLGEANFALVDTTTHLLYQGQHPNWDNSPLRITSSPYAMAVRYDREAAQEWLNGVLNNMQQDGRMGQIIGTWFNTVSSEGN